MNLSSSEKIAFSYIKDKCDNAGVWIPNFKLAEFLIGEKIDWNNLIEKVNDNIQVLECGKWWISEFCDFQYGNLIEDSPNRAHQSYVNLLKKHNLWSLYQGAFKGHRRGINAHKEKDKDKDLDKDKEKDKEYDGPYIEFWKQYPRKLNKSGAYSCWKARLKEGVAVTLIMKCLKNYKQKVVGTEEEYILHPSTFLNKGHRFKDFEKWKPGNKTVEAEDKGWLCDACKKTNYNTMSFCTYCKAVKEEDMEIPGLGNVKKNTGGSP